VLNSRCFGRAKKLQYLLQWKGYSHAHDSWQDATEIHTPDLVKEYHQRKPAAVRAVTLKGQQEWDGGNPMFQNSLTEIYNSEDDMVILFAEERLNKHVQAFNNDAWMEAQLNASPLATPTMAQPPPSKEDSTKRVVAHPPKKGGDVTVLQPHRSGWPAQPNTSSSNTSSSSASQSTLQAVAPDTLDWRTAQVLATRRAARQEQYDKSAFPARLAEALQRHSMAVWVGRTSTHVMQGIINELARLQRA
jgi:Chromo (CHRromatin Organisation MOdifier) domain